MRCGGCVSERMGVVAISLVVILVQAFYDGPHLMWLGALRALRCVCVAEGVDVGSHMSSVYSCFITVACLNIKLFMVSHAQTHFHAYDAAAFMQLP